MASSTQRGYGVAWRRLRVRVFQVYGRACYLCGAPATAVDHLDPIATHGRALPDITRVRPVCAPCNTTRANKLRRKRPKIRSRDW